MSAPTPRPGILDIQPYQGGKSQIDGVSQVIKLASNEGALGPSPKAVAAHRAVSEGLHRYPDGGSDALRRGLAAKYDLAADQIVCGAGSDELITLLVRAYAGPGDEVLYSAHGFLMYAIASKGVGATPVTAGEDGLTASVDNLLAAVTARTRIVFLANPNNPTGTYLPAHELARLRAGLREDILLVIDAAYAEFMEEADYEPGLELVAAGGNVVMTRTFSKIYGLGGLRLGWAYCPIAVADVLNRLRNPFNVTLSAQAAGLAALEDDAFVTRCREHNRDTRAWFTAQVNQLPGLNVPPSFGNFVLVRFPPTAGKNADAANDFLMARGVIPRKIGAYGLPQMLRISIGTRAEMETCLDVLRDFVRQCDD